MHDVVLVRSIDDQIAGKASFGPRLGVVNEDVVAAAMGAAAATDCRMRPAGSIV